MIFKLIRYLRDIKFWPWEARYYFTSLPTLTGRQYKFMKWTFIGFLKANKIKYREVERIELVDPPYIIQVGKKDLNLILLVFGDHFHKNVVPQYIISCREETRYLLKNL